MVLDCWATLPPQTQAFLTQVGTGVLTGWVKELTIGLFKAAGGRVARRFQDEPTQKALEETLTEALSLALATLPLESDLADYYRDLFGDFLQRQDVQEELSLILDPRPQVMLDLDLLRQEFEAAGYDLDYLPDLDLDRFIATLVPAYALALG